MPTFYGAIDLSTNELRNAVVQNLPSAPTGVKGRLYMNTGDNTLYWYDGSQWIAAKAAAGAAPAATVTTQAVGDAPVVGVSTNFAREDHKHGREGFGGATGSLVFGLAASTGSALTVPHSDHHHGTPTHDNSAHSGINLSALAAPTAAVSFGGFRITSLGAPSAATDAANKQYVDDAVAGLNWKAEAELATTANITLSGTANTIDGLPANVVGMSVLVKNQTDATTNGIYTVQSGAWTRRTDADTVNDLVSAAIWVAQGSTQADTAWVCTNDTLTTTIGTSNITFVQFAGGGSITAGAGMTQVGNVLNVIAGDTSVVVNADELHVNTAVMATVASLAGYAPTSRLVTAGAGLTGGGDLSANRTLDVVAGDTSLTVAADSVVVNTGVIATVASVTAAVAGMAKKFAGALTGTVSPEVVTHNLNTRDVMVEVLNGASPYTAVEVDWDATSVNTVTIRFNPVLGAGYRVVVVG